jgi:co-chaperonin GroES (HSP10)
VFAGGYGNGNGNGGNGNSSPSSFNQAGNILISDQFNNRVIEIDPNSKSIVWSFGSGNSTNCNPGPGSIIGSNDADRLANGLTVMAGTGIPPNTVPGLPGGCSDNRVIVVDQNGGIVWQYGQAGQSGNGTNLLNVPVFVIQLPNQDFLIVDQGNGRIIEVNQQKSIVWSYGGLNNPNSAELLANGNILIADENNNRTIEVNRAGQIVWQYNQGLKFAAFASRLPNGNTLITDSGNARIIEVTPGKQIVWQYSTNTTQNSNSSPLPTNAVRLANGDTVIADQFNDRVLMLDQNKNIVFQYGQTNTPGVGPNQLYGPYTAYVIGDYTGRTIPPSSGLPVPEFPSTVALIATLITIGIVLRKKQSSVTDPKQ